MYYVETRDIVKQYTGHLALDKVSIQVPEAKIYGLLGPNGAGKTTLIRILNQITNSDSGQVLINGNPLREKDIYNIGYLPEERGLYKKMKVAEQALYLARLKGLSKQDAQKRLKYWFDKFNIRDWADKKLEELSKGMQQKVQFIITILHEPKLLILDEPFSGFDPVNTQMIKEEILNLKDKGATVLFSTHNMASVEEICDEIGLINKSRLILQGKVQDIKLSHRSGIYLVRLRLPEDLELAKSRLEKSPFFKIESSVPDNYYWHLELSIQAGFNDNNTIFKELLENYDIVSFEEKIPTMHEIFIKSVQS
ncbi:MAG: ATP-binding cassette domain-containing protein [Bacteroidales bacterium]|nr:ATP-binding cassette domain-containing protein [Bacteroidales bacterium]MDD3431016.1 ATP-binding cassette domain-containing protein [Bacteroidales bacterium]MDD4361392.1 ATP-binding cassette domain-containing protein [Bacteroidales bacterium]MDD4431114.1 ATP-binding cassette domain-containing protein [Bacteroidales bacterium]